MYFLGVCPSGAAWSDKPSAATSAHAVVECSNAGICDRLKGECTCFTGFTGDACQRKACPNDCNGHGLCRSMAEIALTDGTDSDQDGAGPVYANWESGVVHVCECDLGFAGPDCSLMLCPYSDDPATVPGSGAVLGTVVITTNAVTSIPVTTAGSGYLNPVVTISGDGSGATATPVVGSSGEISSITVTAGGTGYTTATATVTDEYQRDYSIVMTTGASSGTLAGTFKFDFMGESFDFDADADNVDASTMDTLLTAHSAIASVTVTRGAVDGNKGAAYTITFTGFESGLFNNIHSHDGNPALGTDIRCIVSGVTSGTTPTCTLTGETTTYLKEFMPCAGRGLCDYTTGYCSCYTGYGDADCGTVTTTVTIADDEPSYLIHATGLTFTGSVLKLQTTKEAASDFKFLELVAGK